MGFDRANLYAALHAELGNVTPQVMRLRAILDGLSLEEAKTALAIMRWDLGMRFASLLRTTPEEFQAFFSEIMIIMFREHGLTREQAALESQMQEFGKEMSEMTNEVAETLFRQNAKTALAVSLQALDIVTNSSMHQHIAVILGACKMVERESTGEDEIGGIVFNQYLHAEVEAASKLIPRAHEFGWAD
jgi:hypothetical protein